MHETEYDRVKKIIEDCPREDLPGVIETLEGERVKALDSGDVERVDNFKELLRLVIQR